MRASPSATTSRPRRDPGFPPALRGQLDERRAAVSEYLPPHPADPQPSAPLPRQDDPEQHRPTPRRPRLHTYLEDKTAGMDGRDRPHAGQHRRAMSSHERTSADDERTTAVIMPLTWRNANLPRSGRVTTGRVSGPDVRRGSYRRGEPVNRRTTSHVERDTPSRVPTRFALPRRPASR